MPNSSKHDMDVKKKASLSNLWGFSPLENIVVFTVAAGTFLMGFSLVIGRPEATKDVLPFATGLIGFLGGLVTSMFKQDKAEKTGGEKEPTDKNTVADKDTADKKDTDLHNSE